MLRLVMSQRMAVLHALRNSTGIGIYDKKRKNFVGASLREAHISGRFSSKCLAFPYRRLWLPRHREVKSTL